MIVNVLNEYFDKKPAHIEKIQLMASDAEERGKKQVTDMKNGDRVFATDPFNTRFSSNNNSRTQLGISNGSLLFNVLKYAHHVFKVTLAVLFIGLLAGSLRLSYDL